MAPVHNKTYSYWTEADDDRLRDLVGQGMPFREIGALMGRNKNACIGRAHRIKLEVLPKPPSNSPKALRDRARKAGIIIEKAFVPAPIPASAVMQDNAPQPLYELPEASTTAFGVPRTLMGMKAHHCRFPFAGEGANTLFCCADREGAGPYCRDHHLLVWRPSPQRDLTRLTKAYR